MSAEPPVTYVETELRRRRYLLVPVLVVLALLLLIGLIAAGLGLIAAKRLTRNSTAVYPDIVAHFERGSIGADESSGMPYWVWQALPRLFPEAFDGRLDYRAFGFLYRTDDQGRQEDLPIGISKRDYRGVDLVWFNCAVCHTGTYRTSENGARVTVAGMPSNNLDLYRFIRFVLEAGADERLGPDTLIPAMQAAGAKLGLIERQVWKFYVIPRVREGFIQRRSRLQPFLAEQAAWGPGRVDTFNPYKLVQMKMALSAIAPGERNGASDFPSIFNQKPREGMQLHWDGNNPSLAERNLSAALGAGVTPATVDHAAIERVAAWLGELQPPRSPHPVDPAAVERGRALYMSTCAACHGYQGADRYVFAGANLGKVEPNSKLGTDPGRLEFLHRGLPPASARRAVCRHALSVQAFRQDRWLRQPAARRVMAAWALPAQRCGADAARSARAARATAAGVRARHRPRRWQERRLRVSPLRARSAAAAGLLLRHPAAGQWQRRPRVRHDAVGGRQG